MDISYEYPNIALGKIKGKMDYAQSYHVYSEISKCIRKKLNIVLDMKQCTFVTSTGMRTLTLLSKICNQKGLKMVIIRLDDYIEDIMRVTGFDTGFTMCNTLDTALLVMNEEE